MRQRNGNDSRTELEARLEIAARLRYGQPAGRAIVASEAGRVLAGRRRSLPIRIGSAGS